jgi:hypothetical protein
MNSLFCSFFLYFLILFPSTTWAALNKCTDANGKVSYSDQPCSNKDGEKPAEVKNTLAFAAIAARESEKNLAQTCARLSEQRSQCRYSTPLEPQLDTLFTSSCDGPIKRDYRDKQRNDRLEQRNNRYYRADKGETDEEKPETKIECGALQATVWRFVKTNFGATLSEKEIKEIEYKLTAVPSDGKEQNYTRSSSKKRY